MDFIEEFVDERLKGSCIQCGAWLGIADTNKDHVPSKGLLRIPLPENLPIVEICATCNSGFSADEEYLFLFLNCVLSGSTDPDRQTDERVARALRRHKKLRARIERSKVENLTIEGNMECVWNRETARIKRVVIKNARGHAFYEYGEPVLTEPEHVCAAPLKTLTVAKREEFENFGTVGDVALWPEVGSRMMTRVLTGQDLRDGWVIVQDNVYRYRVEQCNGMLVRSVLFEYLATEVRWSDY